MAGLKHHMYVKPYDTDPQHNLFNVSGDTILSDKGKAVLWTVKEADKMCTPLTSLQIVVCHSLIHGHVLTKFWVV